jgi:two-component system response regulator AtoC
MDNNKEKEFVIGVSSTARKLRDAVKRLSRVVKNALIVGEPGLGKGTLALAVHRESMLSHKKPFVAINPHVMSDGELKALLFREGVKEQTLLGKNVPELVRGSTLLIEEVEELSFINQARVAKFLQEQRGKDSVRIIFTLKSNPERLVKDYKLSEELYAQFSDFEEITIQPLRERAEDIPYFIKYFVDQTCQELGVGEKAIDTNTVDFLTKQMWKENIQELKSVIDNAVLSSQGDTLTLPETILNEHMQLETIINNINLKKPTSIDQTLENIEKLLIQRALNLFGFNQSKASQILGITEPTLRYKMKKLGITPSRKRWAAS